MHMMQKLLHGEEKTLKMLMTATSGLAGSPTQIAKASDKVRKGKGVMIDS